MTRLQWLKPYYGAAPFDPAGSLDEADWRKSFAELTSLARQPAATWEAVTGLGSRNLFGYAAIHHVSQAGFGVLDMDEIVQSSAAVMPGAGRTTEELFPLVYEELRRLAAGKLACERAGQTLQPTALVHEAWLRLSASSGQSWEGRTHFFGAAAEAMRRILVDNARRKLRMKHGGGVRPLPLEEMDMPGPLPDPDLVALDEALTELAQVDKEAADLVNLRFFGGLTQAQAAEQLNISRSSADRSWVFARAWLYHCLRPADALGGEGSSVRPIS